jgi:ribonuclease R
MIHVSELGAEYFQHNEVLHELRGERTGRRFRLYDSLVVQVARVDLDARRIEFQLVPSMIRATRASRPAEREQDFYALPQEEESESDMPPWLAEALATGPASRKKSSKKHRDKKALAPAEKTHKEKRSKKSGKQKVKGVAAEKPKSGRSAKTARQPAGRAGSARKSRRGKGTR